MNIALIPARAGSKRLPGKNFKSFNGLPLFLHSYNSAINSKRIDKCIISTDCVKIIKYCLSNNIPVLKRPDEFCQDNSSTYDVLFHLLKKLSLKPNDLIITLQPTNPLRPKNLIDDMISEIVSHPEKDITSLISTTEIVKKVSIINKNNVLKNLNYKFGQRSQDHFNKKLVYENGLVYITKVSTLINEECMFGIKPCSFLVDESYVTDIDTILDWKEALNKFKKFKNENWK